MKTMLLSLGNIILLKEKRGMRESISTLVDNNWGSLDAEERGVWVSQEGGTGLEFSRKKGQMCFFFFFPLHSLVLVTQNIFFFNPELMNTQQSNSD